MPKIHHIEILRVALPRPEGVPSRVQRICGRGRSGSPGRRIPRCSGTGRATTEAPACYLRNLVMRPRAIAEHPPAAQSKKRETPAGISPFL